MGNKLSLGGGGGVGGGGTPSVGGGGLSPDDDTQSQRQMTQQTTIMSTPIAPQLVHPIAITLLLIPKISPLPIHLKILR